LTVLTIIAYILCFNNNKAEHSRQTLKNYTALNLFDMITVLSSKLCLAYV
jgi:hypothetical protein